MGLRDRFRRKGRPAPRATVAGGLRDRLGKGGTKTVLDREGTDEDLDHLRRWSLSRRGVELFVEPETTATDTTVVAVAHDGEWSRRRVGSPRTAAALARELSLPIYDVHATGYPPRMREWTRNNPDRPRLT